MIPGNRQRELICLVEQAVLMDDLDTFWDSVTLGLEELLFVRDVLLAALVKAKAEGN